MGNKPITNAWLKIYEILNILNNRCNEKIKVFHICEAPGAFISACDYFFKCKKIKYDWYAQSLVPNNNDALDDHYGLIANNK